MSLKRQTLWSILPLASVTLVNLVSVPLFYRYLGAEMYALWFYVATFMGAFGFMDFGMGVAVGRYVGVSLGRGDVSAAREYWGTGNLIVIPLLAVMAIAFAGIGVWFGPVWFNVAPENVSLLRWSFVAGGAGLFFSYYSQFWLMLSQAHLDFRFLGILRTGVSLLQVLPSIPLAWATRNPLVLILWAAAISFLQLLIFVWHARRSYQWGFCFAKHSWERAKEMALYTTKTLVTLVVNAFSAVDRLILGRLAPAADFAHYNICVNVGLRIQGLSVAVMGPVFSQTNRAVGGGDPASPAAVYDETFNFTFPWYLLLSVWVAVWHPVLLRLWLGQDLAAVVEPMFVPVIIASCLTAISNISTAQLGSLNRVGTGLFFNVGTACLFVVAVYVGWHWNGVAGVAWAFLASRVVMLAQDLFVIRLVRAGGWLSKATWRQIGTQICVGLMFALSLLIQPPTSFWHLIPALLHGALVAAWLLRQGTFRGKSKAGQGQIA
jgi:O-antigen/teichoic acid export membrane protein